ncbi:MAG: M15 family metallopeptidase [Burkholderiales bacterium]
MIELIALDRTFILDIRYATPNNFTGRACYPKAACWLREPVAQRLVRVQAELRQVGLGLKVFDAYRPFSVQQQFWAFLPDARFIAQPVSIGGTLLEGSKHSRGAAVDVTLVDANGIELEMPSAFDDFSERAHRRYSGASVAAMANRERLQQVMVKYGFEPLETEWWHFDDPEWARFELSDKELV